MSDLRAADHLHQFGRGANGICRACGTESNAGRRRREARESREVEIPKFDLYAALSAKSGVDHEGNAE